MQVPRWKVAIRRVDELNVVKSVTLPMSVKSSHLGLRRKSQHRRISHPLEWKVIRTTIRANERKRIWSSRDFLLKKKQKKHQVPQMGLVADEEV